MAVTAALLLACGESSSTASTPKPTPTPTPTPLASATPDALALAALVAGRYTGTWNNTTFGSSGPITLDVKVDRAAGTVSFTLTLGGNVFGAPAPPPETYTIKPDATQLSQLSYSGRSAIFGDVTATATMTGTQGTFKMVATAVPNPRIGGFEATATVSDPRSASGRYTVGFKDGSPPAQGTFTLAKAA
jgi:hypothetical protein